MKYFTLPLYVMQLLASSRIIAVEMAAILSCLYESLAWLLTRRQHFANNYLSSGFRYGKNLQHWHCHSEFANLHVNSSD
jgi:hypothetical protein